MTTALIPSTLTLDTLWTAHLLCEVCASQPWTQREQWHPALVCAACAAGEPVPEDDPPGR